MLGIADRLPDSSLGRPPEGLRERKKRQTRQALQASARRLVLERGFDNVGVAEIAEAANFSKRTFFNYFESKEAAVVDPPDGQLTLMLAALNATDPAEPLLSRVCAAHAVVSASDLDDFATRWRLIRSTPALYQRFNEVMAIIEAIVARWVRAQTDEPAPSVFPPAVAALGSTVLRLAIGSWDPDESQCRLTERIGEVHDSLARAFTGVATRRAEVPSETPELVDVDSTDALQVSPAPGVGRAARGPGAVTEVGGEPSPDL